MFAIDDLKKTPEKKFDLVVDRLITRNDDDFYDRLADAVEIAFYEGKGACSILELENKKRKIFSNKFELDGIKFLNLIFIYLVSIIPLVLAQNAKVLEM